MAIQPGAEFGRLTVVEKSAKVGKNYAAYYRCKCICGAECVVRGTSLTTKATRSCGCLHLETAKGQRENLRRANTTHGLSATRAYHAWNSMWDRCTNPANANFDRYGRRGITVCERWNDVRNFVSDMGQPPPGYTLDRIDNNGDYEPNNCRWATHKEQSNNRTTNRLIAYRGERKTAAQWAAVTGVSEKLIARRLRDGWPAERLFETPRRKHSITHCRNGHEFTLDNTAVSNGLRFCLTCRKLRNAKPKPLKAKESSP